MAAEVLQQLLPDRLVMRSLQPQGRSKLPEVTVSSWMSLHKTVGFQTHVFSRNTVTQPSSACCAAQHCSILLGMYALNTSYNLLVADTLWIGCGQADKAY